MSDEQYETTRVRVWPIRRGFAGIVAMVAKPGFVAGYHSVAFDALVVGRATREHGNRPWDVLLYSHPGCSPEGAEEMTARTQDELEAYLKDRLRKRGAWWQ